MKRDWKKELRRDCGNYFRADGDNGEISCWDRDNFSSLPRKTQRMCPFALEPVLVERLIESLLSEQEEEWKQNVRVAIEEAYELGFEKRMVRKGMSMKYWLFKKYNCELVRYQISGEWQTVS